MLPLGTYTNVRLTRPVLSFCNQSAPLDSKDLARECIAKMAVNGLHGGQIDLGGDTHTEFSHDPNGSMNAFLDLLTLIDATVIVRTGSSFSGVVVTIRDMSCKAVLDTALTPRMLAICTPRGFR